MLGVRTVTKAPKQAKAATRSMGPSGVGGLPVNVLLVQLVKACKQLQAGRHNHAGDKDSATMQRCFCGRWEFVCGIDSWLMWLEPA